MATVPITIIGYAYITDLGVGGGPMPGGPNQTPPWGPGMTPSPPGIWHDPGGYHRPGEGIWGGGPHPQPPIAPGGQPGQPPQGGGQPGTPTFPIWGPPGTTLPPGSGYPPVAGHPLPEPPTEGAKPIVGWEAKVFWGPENGWAVAIVPKEGTNVPTPSGQPPQPKK